jgi:anthranilate/para-aminobenzoate synthase component I
MNFSPLATSLRFGYERQEVVPLSFKIPCSQNAFQVFQKLNLPAPRVLLESAAFHSRHHLYSYIAFDPWMTFQSQGRNVQIERCGKVDRKKTHPFEALKTIFKQYPARSWAHFPSFTSGAVGFFSYDLVREFENLKTRHKEKICSDIELMFPRSILALNHATHELQVITLLIPSVDGSWKNAYSGAVNRLEKIEAHLKSVCEVEKKYFKSNPIQAQLSFRQFETMVQKAKRYIQAGDIYQANLSQRFDFTYSGSLEPFYEKLKHINPSPFSSFLDFGKVSVAGCSPERLISKRGPWCQTRPIAGTRPRGKNEKQDSLLQKELFLNEKERAEHLMLVDLERNDLGRVCDFDTVAVNEFMTLESYSHVSHIVSNVTGRLKKECDSLDLIRALFPGGTITGCPKIRCMQIIDELEPHRRNLYTGSLGYLDFSGNLDLNIIIRSLVAFENCASIQVGAGIVWDSNPEKEYEETLFKAQALFQALHPSATTRKQAKVAALYE